MARLGLDAQGVECATAKGRKSELMELSQFSNTWLRGLLLLRNKNTYHAFKKHHITKYNY
eukprot:5951740-Amphidinium_carterae.1